MKRRRRKSLPCMKEVWICHPNYHKFGEVLLWISPRIINASRKLAPRFSTHFSVFGYLMKHSSLCLMYYFSNAGFKLRQLNILRLGLYTTLKCVREYLSCEAPRLVLGGLSLCSVAIRFFSTFYESLSKPHVLRKKNSFKICIDWNTFFMKSFW